MKSFKQYYLQQGINQVTELFFEKLGPEMAHVLLDKYDLFDLLLDSNSRADAMRTLTKMWEDLVNTPDDRPKKIPYDASKSLKDYGLEVQVDTTNITTKLIATTDEARKMFGADDNDLVGQAMRFDTRSKTDRYGTEEAATKTVIDNWKEHGRPSLWHTEKSEYKRKQQQLTKTAKRYKKKFPDITPDEIKAAYKRDKNGETAKTTTSNQYYDTYKANRNYDFSGFYNTGDQEPDDSGWNDYEQQANAYQRAQFHRMGVPKDVYTEWLNREREYRDRENVPPNVDSEEKKPKWSFFKSSERNEKEKQKRWWKHNMSNYRTTAVEWVRSTKPQTIQELNDGLFTVGELEEIFRAKSLQNSFEDRMFPLPGDETFKHKMSNTTAKDMGDDIFNKKQDEPADTDWKDWDLYKKAQQAAKEPKVKTSSKYKSVSDIGDDIFGKDDFEPAGSQYGHFGDMDEYDRGRMKRAGKKMKYPGDDPQDTSADDNPQDTSADDDIYKDINNPQAKIDSLVAQLKSLKLPEDVSKIESITAQLQRLKAMVDKT